MKHRLFWSLGASLTILALAGARMVVPAESTSPASPEADVAVAAAVDDDSLDDPSPAADTDAPATMVSDEKPLPPNIKPNGPLAEVIKLANSGLEESVLLAFATNSTQTFNLTAEEIIYLKDIGIPGSVVTAMMQRDQELKGALPGPPAPQTEPPPAPVDSNLTPPGPADFSLSTPPAESELVEAPLTPPDEVSTPEFYDSLAPYGNWVNVAGYGQCWQPTVVTIVPSWQPYFDCGHWLYSDCGWYWASSYSWGWAPFHYGRWFRHSHLGWCWQPGHTWGPSWVSWRYTDRHCGWAPLPPGATFVAGVGLTYHGRHVGEHDDLGLRPGHYRFVDWNHFNDRQLRHERLAQREATHAFDQAVVSTRISGANNTVVNNGLPPSRVAAATGRPIQTVALRDPRHGGRFGHSESGSRALGVHRVNPNSPGNSATHGNQSGAHGTGRPSSSQLTPPSATPWMPRAGNPRQASIENNPEGRPASSHAGAPLVLRGPQSSAARENVPPNSLVVIGRQPSVPSAASAVSVPSAEPAEFAPSAPSVERAARADRATAAPRAASASTDGAASASVARRPPTQNGQGNWMGTVSSSPQPAWFSGAPKSATATGNSVPNARPQTHTSQPQPRSFQPAPYQPVQRVEPAPYQPAPRVALEVPRYAPAQSYVPQRSYAPSAAAAPAAPPASVQARPSAPSAAAAHSAPAPASAPARSNAPMRR